MTNINFLKAFKPKIIIQNEECDLVHMQWDEDYIINVSFICHKHIKYPEAQRKYQIIYNNSEIQFNGWITNIVYVIQPTDTQANATIKICTNSIILIDSTKKDAHNISELENEIEDEIFQNSIGVYIQ